MTDISDRPTKNDAIIRLYKHQLHLNERASGILNLNSRYRRLRFTFADEDGARRIFVASVDSDTERAYLPVRNGKTFRIYSTTLCRALIDSLDGPGVYRINPSDTVYQDNRIYYEIKKYK